MQQSRFLLLAALIGVALATPATADGPIGQRQWSFNPHGSTSCQPVLAENTVLISMHPRLYALDPATGKPRWSAPGRFWYPAIAGKHAFASFRDDDRGVACYDLATGKPIHRIVLAKGNAAPRFVVAEGAVLLHEGNDVRAYDAATGKLRWTVTLKGRATEPVVAAGQVYVTARDGKGASQLDRIDLTTGKVAWSKRLEGHWSRLAVTADRLVATVQSPKRFKDELHCLDLDGTFRWRARTGHTPHKRAVLHGDETYVVGKDGASYWVACLDDKGLERWRADMGTIRLGPPSPRGKWVYCSTLNNRVVVLDAATGRKIQEQRAACTSWDHLCAAGGRILVRNGSTLECWKAPTPGAEAWPHTQGGPGRAGLPLREGGPR